MKNLTILLNSCFSQFGLLAYDQFLENCEWYKQEPGKEGKASEYNLFY